MRYRFATWLERLFFGYSIAERIQLEKLAKAKYQFVNADDANAGTGEYGGYY